MKPIKLTQSTLAKAKKDILAQLNSIRLQGTKISINYDFADIIKDQINASEIKKPIVYMLANTYLKMLEYVLTCNTEIAWHGTVERGKNDQKHVFFIKDVYLYPQKIAAATVQVDDDKYTQWSDAQETETFNHRRFQGHSHVNMGTIYSGTDEANKREFLQDLLDDDFYIFLVTNKRQEHNFEIYDLASNIIFENKDIDFRVYLDKNEVLDSVNDDIKKFCTKPTYNLVPNYSTKSYYGAFFDEDNYHSKYYNDLYNKDTSKSNTKPVSSKKVKKYVVLMNKQGRNFEKEYRQYIGEVTSIRFNGQDYSVFVPYQNFKTDDITELRKDGWNVREMPVPEEYDFEGEEL